MSISMYVFVDEYNSNRRIRVTLWCVVVLVCCGVGDKLNIIKVNFSVF